MASDASTEEVESEFECDVQGSRYSSVYDYSHTLTMSLSSSSISPSSMADSARIHRTSLFSRERNRMHARKTRQRKKEHMQKLQEQVDDLKHEQIRIKQAINEKNTANILIGLFQNGESSDTSSVPTADPEVEELLKRAPEDIPDASAIPELPALILPGNGKRKLLDTTGGDAAADGGERVLTADETLEDGIDYILLGKDRSACTTAELDQIRRERNRMHAKRTRDRKRIFMEEMEVMIKKLEDENLLLMSHAKKLNAHVPLADADDKEDRGGDRRVSFTQSDSSDPLFTGESNSTSNSNIESNRSDDCRMNNNNDGHERSKGDFLNQIESLLAAAESFQRSGNVETSTGEVNAITCAESDVTTSTHSYCDEEMYDNGYEMLAHLKKRRNTSSMDHGVPSSCSVPKSITTTNYSFE